MLALLRLIVIGFVVLTIIYIALSIYSRRVRRVLWIATFSCNEGSNDMTGRSVAS